MSEKNMQAIETEKKTKIKAETKTNKKAEKKASKELKSLSRDKQRQRKLNRRQLAKKTDIKWDKLDNTANLFPVIASRNVSNVYRVAVTLNEEIDPDILQEALDQILPLFDVFNVRLRKGLFWYYFETNRKEAPWIREEDTYPCRYMNSHINNNYLFRISYYKRRINLEAFHVLTDGNGAFTFLKELTYQYLRIAHPELKAKLGDHLSSETSLNREDSYLKNYKKSATKGYKTEKAYIIKGEQLPPQELGVMHGYINLSELKTEVKRQGVSINQYLVAVLFWSIYQEYLHEQPSNRPICACVPVNLRPYFNSITTKNFFAVVAATFKPERDNYTFEEVLTIISNNLKEQINKEHLERLFSYNVSNEKNAFLRAVPLFVKNIAMKCIYQSSARANTTTLTNLGMVEIVEDYRPYIEQFYAMIPPSVGQPIKAGICTYGEQLVITFTSVLKDTSIQKAFFRKLTEKNVTVSVESNGVYYE